MNKGKKDINIKWTFTFKDINEKEEFFNHAKNVRKMPLSQLFRELMQFEISGTYRNGIIENKNVELIEILERKIELLEQNISDLINNKLDNLILMQNNHKVINNDVKNFVLSKIDGLKSITEIQDSTNIELNVLYQILEDLRNNGMIEQDWKTQRYKKSLT